jgi:hypothetical protein
MSHYRNLKRKKTLVRFNLKAGSFQEGMVLKTEKETVEVQIKVTLILQLISKFKDLKETQSKSILR